MELREGTKPEDTRKGNRNNRTRNRDQEKGKATAPALNKNSEAMELRDGEMPFINSLKSLTGHCLSSAGSIECVASILQISEDFVFGNINSEDLHPEIAEIASRKKVPE